MFEGVVGRSCLSDIAIDGFKTETCGGGEELTEVSTLNTAFFHVVKLKKKTAKRYQCITNFIHRFHQQLFHHFHIRAPHQKRQRHRLLLSVSYQERSREGVAHEVLSLVQGVGCAIFSYP